MPIATDKNETTLRYLQKLAEAEFWGSMTLKLEAGRVVHIRKEESLKPNELSEEPRVRDAKQVRG